MPGVGGERELLREPASAPEDRRLALGRRRAHDRTFGASRPRIVPPRRAGLVVDVDAVAARDVADEPAGAVDRDRDGALLPGELRRDRVGQADAQVGGRDLLAGEDVRDGDAAVEVRGVGDRADLEVVLRERRGLEELLLGDDRARGALRDQVLRDEHGRRRGRVVDARAVLDEVGDQQDRRERRGRDAERERPAARLRDLGGE